MLLLLLLLLLLILLHSINKIITDMIIIAKILEKSHGSPASGQGGPERGCEASSRAQGFPPCHRRKGVHAPLSLRQVRKQRFVAGDHERLGLV